MIRITNLFFQTSLQHISSRSLFFGILTTASLVTSSLTFSPHADAQTPAVNNSVNNTDITSYAQAVLAMETPRQQAFDEIKKLIGGGEIPKIICNDSNSMNGLPRKVQNIAVTYCEDSKKIVENNGLSIDLFNKITVELQNNNNLKREVYNTLIRLQKTPETR
ncbi:DUF4168 domain-containing protein [Nodularia spumigena CS-584]|jgi:hypothetical protein|uniref:DUF4168 domain-containing protein n=2 Tax=Nodularia spumigena TaxID=70799 RepID=A0A2S0Q8N4_NODSP|nr:DUF4168 domain-containing protein [Nodularia spumigena]AHJ30984.1 hypothetical protein NSP_46930 [Nodularia spumigena CCY9414]AVZ30731.1 hypothetical protein BMF81_02651 [Nodularia spumigena UHCC 0039]EAW46371.1 hypothetical protein N9414_11704 [Nodularia spumigena CCY9414]MDB9382752.1 DUF4168 domain-containing protein [Nodularia spumigena CS-584]MEA5523506.1 DUF4168 domain-containing protein [Nodularia spumigena UHCC 0143]